MAIVTLIASIVLFLYFLRSVWNEDAHAVWRIVAGTAASLCLGITIYSILVMVGVA